MERGHRRPAPRARASTDASRRCRSCPMDRDAPIVAGRLPRCARARLAHGPHACDDGARYADQARQQHRSAHAISVALQRRPCIAHRSVDRRHATADEPAERANAPINPAALDAQARAGLADALVAQDAPPHALAPRLCSRVHAAYTPGAAAAARGAPATSARIPHAGTASRPGPRPLARGAHSGEGASPALLHDAFDRAAAGALAAFASGRRGQYHLSAVHAPAQHTEPARPRVEDLAPRHGAHVPRAVVVPDPRREPLMSRQARDARAGLAGSVHTPVQDLAPTPHRPSYGAHTP